jgi:hypothetical protein
MCAAALLPIHGAAQGTKSTDTVAQAGRLPVGRDASEDPQGCTWHRVSKRSSSDSSEPE